MEAATDATKFPETLPEREPSAVETKQVWFDIVIGNAKMPEKKRDQGNDEEQMMMQMMMMQQQMGGRMDPRMMQQMMAQMKPQKKIDQNSWEKVRVSFELFGKELPKTTENMVKICSGKAGFDYKGCKFHKLVLEKSGQFIMGGDVTKQNGTGGKSADGGFFPDEGIYYPFAEEGMIAMNPMGKGQNGSQFMINFGPIAPQANLHKQMTVFGRNIGGLETFIKYLQEFGFDKNGQPKYPITIIETGENEGWSKKDFNGNSLGWNDYVKNGAGCEGITSPEREFDKAWFKLTQEHEIGYRDDVTEEFLALLPELEEDSDHLFHKDRQAFINSKLPDRAEEEANDNSDREMY